MPPSITAAIARLHAAMGRVANGDVTAIKALCSHSADVTSFYGWGGWEQGCEAVSRRWDWAGEQFKGGTVSYQSLTVVAADTLFYTTDIETFEMRAMDGLGRPTRWSNRVTHIFRLEDDEWHLLHRHGNRLEERYKPATRLGAQAEPRSVAKLDYRKGDLLAATEPVIAHGCNAEGVMGAGVAAAIRKRWPEAYEAYRKRYEEHGLTPGEIVLAETGGKVIANAITQATQGIESRRYASYDALADCMAEIARFATANGLGAVAMPRIGAGLANGDWAIIERIVERQLVAQGIDVVVYEL